MDALQFSHFASLHCGLGDQANLTACERISTKCDADHIRPHVQPSGYKEIERITQKNEKIENDSASTLQTSQLI